MKSTVADSSIVMCTSYTKLGGGKASSMFYESPGCSGSSSMTVSSSKSFPPSVTMLLHHGHDAPSMLYPLSNRGSKSDIIEMLNFLGLGLLIVVAPSVHFGRYVSSKLNYVVLVVNSSDPLLIVIAYSVRLWRFLSSKLNAAVVVMDYSVP